jgi:DNA-binding transcriptional LysR family regulator
MYHVGTFRQAAAVGFAPKIDPRVTMETRDTEVIKCLVECGFGYSILPEHALLHSTGYFHTLRVAGHPLARKQALVLAQSAGGGRALTGAVALFLKKELDTPIAGRAA